MKVFGVHRKVKNEATMVPPDHQESAGAVSQDTAGLDAQTKDWTAPQKEHSTLSNMEIGVISTVEQVEVEVSRFISKGQAKKNVRASKKKSARRSTLHAAEKTQTKKLTLHLTPARQQRLRRYLGFPHMKSCSDKQKGIEPAAVTNGHSKGKSAPPKLKIVPETKGCEIVETSIGNQSETHVTVHEKQVTNKSEPSKLSMPVAPTTPSIQRSNQCGTNEKDQEVSNEHVNNESRPGTLSINKAESRIKCVAESKHKTQGTFRDENAIRTSEPSPDIPESEDSSTGPQKQTVVQEREKAKSGRTQSTISETRDSDEAETALEGQTEGPAPFLKELLNHKKCGLRSKASNSETKPSVANETATIDQSEDKASLAEKDLDKSAPTKPSISGHLGAMTCNQFEKKVASEPSKLIGHSTPSNHDQTKTSLLPQKFDEKPEQYKSNGSDSNGEECVPVRQEGTIPMPPRQSIEEPKELKRSAHEPSGHRKVESALGMQGSEIAATAIRKPAHNPEPSTLKPSTSKPKPSPTKLKPSKLDTAATYDHSNERSKESNPSSMSKEEEEEYDDVQSIDSAYLEKLEKRSPDFFFDDDDYLHRLEAESFLASYDEASFSSLEENTHFFSVADLIPKVSSIRLCRANIDDVREERVSEPVLNSSILESAPNDLAFSESANSSSKDRRNTEPGPLEHEDGDHAPGPDDSFCDDDEFQHPLEDKYISSNCGSNSDSEDSISLSTRNDDGDGVSFTTEEDDNDKQFGPVEGENGDLQEKHKGNRSGDVQWMDDLDKEEMQQWQCAYDEDEQVDEDDRRWFDELDSDVDDDIHSPARWQVSTRGAENGAKGSSSRASFFDFDNNDERLQRAGNKKHTTQYELNSRNGTPAINRSITSISQIPSKSKQALRNAPSWKAHEHSISRGSETQEKIVAHPQFHSFDHWNELSRGNGSDDESVPRSLAL